MNTPIRVFFSLAVLFFAGALSAQTKPNFSGTWQLNVTRSDLGGAPLSKLIVQIEHKEPVYKYTAKGTADGQDFEENETFTTDGKPGTDSRGGIIKAHWEGATLLIEASDPDGTTFEARIGMSEDAKTITSDVMLKGAYGPQKRHEIYDKQ